MLSGLCFKLALMSKFMSHASLHFFVLPFVFSYACAYLASARSLQESVLCSTVFCNVSCKQMQDLKMSRDDTLSHYEKLMHLSPETTNEELRELYSSWRHNYDKDALEGLEYVAPIIAAEKLSKTLEESGYGKDATILDLGCGTGVVGEELYKHGYRAIDGLDICPEILETAKAKGVYKKLSQGAMGSDGCKDLSISPNQYDAAICIGVFVVGHVKGKGFDDLLYVLKPAGLACFTIRDCIANDPCYGKNEGTFMTKENGSWLRKVMKNIIMMIQWLGCIYTRNYIFS